ncbi:MAG: hypothetical protein ACE5NW_09285 [Acidiferrobacterales bacterium]
MIIAGVNTGMVESWAGNIADMGPIYPFVGGEVLFWIIGLILWICWHVWQIRFEGKTYDEEAKRFGGKPPQ